MIKIKVDNKIEKTTMISPWMIYVHQLEAMFKQDPMVKVHFDEETFTVKLYVEGNTKAEALMELLPDSKKFGNVELKIRVLPANLGDSKVDLFYAAFEGNPALSYIKTISGVSSNEFNFVVFKKEVVQYYSDNLGDINGVNSTLYQDLAKELFGTHDGVYYCTDTE